MMYRHVTGKALGFVTSVTGEVRRIEALSRR